MNGRQRSKRYAHAACELQRLYKQVRGADDASYVLLALRNMEKARDEAGKSNTSLDTQEPREGSDLSTFSGIV